MTSRFTNECDESCKPLSGHFGANTKVGCTPLVTYRKFAGNESSAASFEIEPLSGIEDRFCLAGEHGSQPVPRGSVVQAAILNPFSDISI
jgi:hypothetical protein